MLRRDFNMDRGTDLVAPTAIARDRAGNVINLTGATITWKVGDYYRFSTSVEMSVGDGVTVVDAVMGAYDLKMAGAKSASLDPGHYYHAVEVTETDGSITIVERGYITIRRDLP